MSQPRLYADHNATVPLRPGARAAMVRALDLGGNASSVHGEGRAARAIVEGARETLAELLGCQPALLTFTGGATEALHLALESAYLSGYGAPAAEGAPPAVFIGAGEHDAVWAMTFALWPQARVIPVDLDIKPDPDWLAGELAGAGPRPLVILQAMNNETGTLVPLGRISTLVRATGGSLLCDAVQAFGKIGAGAFQGFADWLVVSSHKIGGPVGAGALVRAPGAELVNRRPGGGQELSMRAGTQNVAAIAGFAAAAAEACTDEAVAAFQQQTGAERDAYEAMLRAGAPDAVIIAEWALRAANTSCVALPGWEAARQVMALDLAGAAVSAGAACSSGKVKASRVLLAGGHSAAVATSAIRASFGWSSIAGDGERLASLHLAAAQRARRLAA
jgi:cysteine desulfurase